MATTTLTRAGLAGTASVLALLIATPAQAASSTSSSASAAAGYLGSSLAASGHRFVTTYAGQSYDDLGLTIDGVLALAATKSAQSELAASASYVTANAASYVGTAGETYAGSLAKYIVMLEATGKNPRSQGGVDLIAKLQGLQGADGHFKDASAYGDYSNTISQSWALIALKRAGVTPSAAAVSFLKAQQCSNGGFRLDLGKSPCVADTDVTSFAVQGLSASGADVTSAVNYLASKQGADGGVGGGVSTPGENANSSGLAAAAFTLAGRSSNAAKAASYVQTLQYPCTAGKALRGAVAYDAAAFRTGLASGTATGQESRTTTQAVLALTGASYVTVTAGGSSAIPSVNCSTSSPTATATTTSPAPTTSTTAPSSSSASSTSSTSSTSVVTGPPVVTDGPAADDGSGGLAVVAGATGLLAAAGAGTVLYGRRRR
ncbi:prenyltransferase/squalene oxidase repeat-containing protein [Calidifontibacter terrae]